MPLSSAPRRFHTVGNDRVRVSYDEKGVVTECIVKEKLQHLDFWSAHAVGVGLA